MDCRSFRKHHFAYLDDTLSGELMAAAQRHILMCDRCAEHDTLVRRSLLLARNIPMVEPSPEFRDRLRERLAECRRSDAPLPPLFNRPFLDNASRVVTMTTALALFGALAWGTVTPEEAPLIAMQPVVASEPALPASPYVSPQLMQAMATGNPVWSAAMVIEEVPTQFVNASYGFSEEFR